MAGRKPTGNTAQISALIDPAHRERMDALADEFVRPFADIVRESIEAGLSLVEEKYARLRQPALDEQTRAARRG